MSDEIKVVLRTKNGKSFVGVQAPNCDPVFRAFDGSLEEALKMVPGVIDEARRKWAANPRHPKANLPAPPPQVSQGQRENRAPQQPASPQPKMF